MSDHVLPGSDPNQRGGLIVSKKSPKADSGNFQKPSILGLQRQQNSGAGPIYNNPFKSRERKDHHNRDRNYVSYKERYKEKLDKINQQNSAENDMRQSLIQKMTRKGKIDHDDIKKDSKERIDSSGGETPLSGYIPATPTLNDDSRFGGDSDSKFYERKGKLDKQTRYENSRKNSKYEINKPGYTTAIRKEANKESWYGNIRSETTSAEQEANYKASEEYKEQQQELDRTWYTLDEGGGEIPELFAQHDETEQLEKKHKMAGLQRSGWGWVKNHKIF